jgi:histidinol-phosphate aminotransferase
MSVLPYSPPPMGEGIDLDLSRNEGRQPSPDLLQRIEDPGRLMGQYPDTTALRRALADLHGLAPERVLVTAGADDALFRCFLARVGPGRSAVATSPSFEMLPIYAAQAGGELIEIEWWDERFPTQEVIKSLSEGAGTAFVVSPNNPTGNVIASEDLTRVADSAELVVLDGAYMEFAEVDLTAEALLRDNVVVLRTMSKAWGLAGLRVGYALGPPDLLSEIGAFGNPYSVTGLSQAIATMQLESRDEIEKDVQEIRRERVELVGVLDDLGVGTLPSQANFVLAGFEEAEWVWRATASLGIGLRRFPDRPRLEAHLRIGLPGRRDAFARLTGAIRTALEPEALLFDLDGVLADIDGSQTAAIIATAAHFGVELDRTDIEEAKAAGNSNDDWALSWRLCTAAGADVSLEEVRSRFETLYQGTFERPGLKLNERLLVERPRLEGWSARYPLGIVTGRPRSDAEEFIERTGIGASFSALVTREDAPLKPDPKPVAKALDRLGVDRAWMLGDTPDDIAAAKGAGVVPIGVVAPASDPRASGDALAGAAAVLDSPNQLEELLP